MNKKYKKQIGVAIAAVLAVTSVANSAGSIFAQKELEINEYDVVNNEEIEEANTEVESLEIVAEKPLESKEEIQSIEKADGDIVIKDSFPDEEFRNYIRDNFDTDGDGILSSDEIDKVDYIDVSDKSNIQSLKGIEHFVNIADLFCDGTGITNLDVSKNTALEFLNCGDTGITNLDVSKNTALKTLRCYNTGITSLDVSKNTALEFLYCSDTGITSLDVSKNTALGTLYCDGTGITSLDVSRNTALETLNCMATGITSLDVSRNTALLGLFVGGNNLKWLYIGENTGLYVSKSPSVFDLGKIGETFNIVDLFSGIDLNRIQNITGANLDKVTGIVSGYVKGTPIQYQYDCGISGQGTEFLDVTLTMPKDESSIIINDKLNKVYDGTAVELAKDNCTITGSTGVISFEWYAADGTLLPEAPTEAGNYKVKAILAEDENYKGAEIEELFEITQAPNQWTKELAIEGWVYEQAANTPSAQAKYGTVEYTYSTTEDGVYTDVVPSNAGIYWIKASVTETDNYKGLETKLSFTIKQAASSITINDKLDKVYDGQAVVEPQVTVTGSKGAVSIEWYQKEETTTKAITWKKLAAAPSAVGEYKVVVTVAEDENYTGLAVEQEFSILENKIAITTPGTGEETTVAPAQGVTGVQTGDNTQAGLWTMLVGLSTGLMMFFTKKNRKEEG